MNLAFFNKYLLITFSALLFTACIPSNKIDVEACKKKSDPCEEYQCLFPGCWCSPNTKGELILFDANKTVNNLEEAKALADLYLESTALEVEQLQVAEDAYGWFYMVFQKKDSHEEFHYAISPKGQICHTECGV